MHSVVNKKKGSFTGHLQMNHTTHAHAPYSVSESSVKLFQVPPIILTFPSALSSEEALMIMRLTINHIHSFSGHTHADAIKVPCWPTVMCSAGQIKHHRCFAAVCWKLVGESAERKDSDGISSVTYFTETSRGCLRSKNMCQSA